MKRISLTVFLFLLALPAQARTVEGVELAETVTTRGGAVLQLHGAGVRDKFIFDIYVGALYLPATGQDATTILGADQPARIEMHFLHDEVSHEKLAAAWRDGFKGNNDPEVLDTIGPELERFIGLFPTAVEGDVFAMEYLPGEGTAVIINGETAGAVGSDVFFSALLGVFLGPEPADDDLKEGMLGTD